MKILQIANGDFFSTSGGGQVYVKNIVDEMIRQRLAISVLSFVNRKNDKSYEQKDYKGIDLYEFYIKDSSIIKELINSIEPDVIHVHSEKTLISSIAKELDIPCVITAHHGGILCPSGTLLNDKDEICRRPASHENCLACVLHNTKGGVRAYPFIKRIPLKQRLQIGRLLNKLPFVYFVTPYGKASLHIEQKKQEWESIMRNADCLIAPSDAIAESMIRNGLSENKVRVVPHGIPIPIQSDQFKYNSSDSRLIKFFQVSVSYEKGTPVLLEAFSQLKDPNIELHIIGAIPTKKVRKLIAPYLSDKRIIFHGKISPERIFETIQSYDVMVHPAIYMEAFGLTISEALSQGKPVIATRCGGAEMQIVDKENGLLVEPNKANELKEAMEWMIYHPQERKAMSEHAPQRVIPMERHVKELINVYTNCI